MSQKIITHHYIENKQLRKENENEKVETRNDKVESRKVENIKEKNEKLKKENEQLGKNNVDVKIKESIEIKSFEEEKNKFKEILAIIDSNKFNYRNKIGELKYIDIKDLVNNIRNNTISERDAKKNLNALNTIKNAEIKFKKLTPKHKELLNLFNDLLNVILTDKTLESKIQEDKNEKVDIRKEKNEKVESRKVKNGKVESRKEENKDENEGDDYDYYYKNEDGDETMDQNKKTRNNKGKR